ncbi:MAG: biotin transporter BioY [Candidatus Omnitrophica bacterium]|nr:biotin transporter BioY [Candidatus Omnitrophota bacterium]MBD3268666.1 biotin transporter BioY [Candidatus Omnitrophota bacterium]
MKVKTLNYQKTLTSSLLQVGLFSLLMAVSANFRFYLPFTPVPVTLQTLVVCLSIVFLKQKAPLSQLIYLTLGIAGFPVFSGGASGILYLFGPTGGYLFGFLLSSFLLPPLLLPDSSVVRFFFCFCLLHIIVYSLGVLWLCCFFNFTFLNSVRAGALPFIAGDLFKVAIACLILRQCLNCPVYGRGKR